MIVRNTLLLLTIGLFLIINSSCKKCGECSIEENNKYAGKFCKGSSFENIIYEKAKEECMYLEGSFK